MSFYEKNKNLIRYTYNKEEKGIFYIGIDILHNLQFKVGDNLILTKDSGKKTYIIEKNIFGEQIYNYSSKISGANFVRLPMPKRITAFFKLPKVEKIIILDYHIYLQENPDDNYVVVKF